MPRCHAMGPQGGKVMVWDVSPQPETKRVWAEVSLKRISIVSWLWSPATLRVAVPERQIGREARQHTQSSRGRADGGKLASKRARGRLVAGARIASGGSEEDQSHCHRQRHRHRRRSRRCHSHRRRRCPSAATSRSVQVCLECPFRALHKFRKSREDPSFRAKQKRIRMATSRIHTRLSSALSSGTA